MMRSDMSHLPASQDLLAPETTQEESRAVFPTDKTFECADILSPSRHSGARCSQWTFPRVSRSRPQIGISKRLAVIDVTFKEDPEAKLVLVNPEIIHTEGKHTQNEGCLSIPEFREPVTRPSKVTVRAQDVSGKWFEKTGDDLLARAFLHETDHLHGKLYISHLSILKRDLMKRKIRKLIKAGDW